MRINKLSIKAISIAIILLLCSSCRVTQHRDFTVVGTARLENMKNSNRTFDIEYFERNKDTGGDLFIIKEDGTRIEQFAFQGYYVEKEDPPPPKLYTIQRMFHSNGNLRVEGILLTSMEVGIWREYDKWGNLIKEVNYDEALPDKFDYNQVVLFMDKRGHICIRTGRGREDFEIWFCEEEQVWGAAIYPSERNGFRPGTRYILDKNTGKVKKEITIYPW